MKILRLRKILIINGAIYTLLLMVVMGGLLYLGGIRDETLEKESRLRMSVNAMNAKLDDMTRKAKEITEATKLWQKLNIKQKKREGLKLDTAHRIIEDLKNRYHLGDVDIDLSTPVELVDIYKTESVVVVSSEVTLKIRALTDEQVLSFADSLIKELPGYIRLKSLTVKRNSELSADILARISKGELPELVYGEMTFQWRDLKDIPVKKAEAGKS